MRSTGQNSSSQNSPRSTQSELHEACLELTKCFHVRVCEERFAVVEPAVPDWIECFDQVIDSLQSRGVQPKLVEFRGELVALFLRVKRSWSSLVSLILAVVTAFTVLWTGVDLARGFIEAFGSTPNPHLLAFSFLVGLLGPLAVHEFGHLTVALVRGIPTTLPVFIPAPPLSMGGIGTFGAIMGMRGLPRDKESLAYLGIAGPLAGFLAGLIVAFIGLQQSPVVHPKVLEEVGGVELGFAPLALMLVANVAVPRAGEGVIVLHPLAFAAYIVFLVTFLNLLPIGQLDGGHVAYAVFGEKVYNMLNYVTLVSAIAAFIIYPPYLFIAVFALLATMLNAIVAGGRHPGVLNPFRRFPLWKRVLVAILYLVLLALTIPIPVS